MSTLRFLFVAIILALLAPIAVNAQTAGPPSTAFMRESHVSVAQVRTLAPTFSCIVSTGTAAVAAAQRPSLTRSSAGIAGYRAWATGNTVLTISSTTTATPIGPLAYPGRVHVAIFDGGAGTTPVCTRFRLEGTNIRGVRVREDVTQTVGEAGSGYLSREIYASLTRVTASGCSGFGASDELHVRSGPWVAVPSLLTTTPVNSLLHVCMSRAGNGINCVAGSAFTQYKSPSAARDTSGTAINLLSAAFTADDAGSNCLPDRMPVVIRYTER